MEHNLTKGRVKQYRGLIIRCKNCEAYIQCEINKEYNSFNSQLLKDGIWYGHETRDTTHIPTIKKVIINQINKLPCISAHELISKMAKRNAKS